MTSCDVALCVTEPAVRFRSGGRRDSSPTVTTPTPPTDCMPARRLSTGYSNRTGLQLLKSKLSELSQCSICILIILENDYVFEFLYCYFKWKVTKIKNHVFKKNRQSWTGMTTLHPTAVVLLYLVVPYLAVLLTCEDVAAGRPAATEHVLQREDELWRRDVL